MGNKSVWPVVGVAVPCMLLALAGLFHPAELTPQTASHWTTLHALLVPVFPLLGLCFWWLAAGIPGGSAWTMRVMGFFHLVFYGAMEVLGGVGAGLMVQKGIVPGSAPMEALDNTTQALSQVGVWAFLAAAMATLALYLQLVGRRAWLGGLLLIGAALSFLNSHIESPEGTLTLLAMGLGFSLLMHARMLYSRH